jgi:lipopolysaccharide/colanic/teichoic acid biosynthesis glycosyltransferase
MTTSTANSGGQRALFAPAKSFPNRLQASRTNQVFKRTADVVVSVLVILLVLSWLVPLLAAAIQLDSPGPVFFRQLRSGRRRRLFLCYKFRTMYHSPENSRFVQATGNDPRVTKFGHFLRKTSLDELPQFFNVLEGTMSIVGPRPHVPDLDAQFGPVITDYFERNTVKPGVTGLAQIKGCRGETRTVDDMADRVQLDLTYARQWSLWLDCKIVLWTAQDVFRHLIQSLRKPHADAPLRMKRLKMLPWYNRVFTRRDNDVDSDNNRWAS